MRAECPLTPFSLFPPVNPISKFGLSQSAQGTQPQVRARFPFDAGAKPVLSSGPGMIAPSPAPPSDARLLARTMVLIPALNEAECIDATVRYWRARFVSLVRVVDNGSTDATAMRAGAAVLAESRRGYGAACWTGLQAIPPAIEWILFSSADGSDQLADADVAACGNNCGMSCFIDRSLPLRT